MYPLTTAFTPMTGNRVFGGARSLFNELHGTESGPNKLGFNQGMELLNLNALEYAHGKEQMGPFRFDNRPSVPTFFNLMELDADVCTPCVEDCMYSIFRPMTRMSISECIDSCKDAGMCSHDDLEALIH